jgi:hypothetical protein
MRCESCHQREATCHVTCIIGDVMQKRDLCPECFEASSPDASRLASAQREARCEYCGGQPCAGGTDFLAMIMGAPKAQIHVHAMFHGAQPISSGALAAGRISTFPAGAVGFAPKIARAGRPAHERVGLPGRFSVRTHKKSVETNRCPALRFRLTQII